MFKWITTEVPEDLAPAKGIIAGIFLAGCGWALFVLAYAATILF